MTFLLGILVLAAVALAWTAADLLRAGAARRIATRSHRQWIDTDSHLYRDPM